ncbi:MAG: A/G-specific adenine glycosylase [Kiritimatiellales bacterium]|nr:A/G-specific adenine glycosylase [Kiritimatiellales bacterium]
MSRDAQKQSGEKTVKNAVKNKLLPWFAANRRDLPWRRNRTPYRVWVSEIMLQQTRVDTVIDYYRRWMKKFPSWRALARAPQADVLKAWEGLGYYSRARNLHAAARIVSDDFNGRLKNVDATPPSRQQGLGNATGASRLHFLKQFPGIGPYTAAAIASLAFNEDAAVVDGNVIRVLCRLFAYGGDTKNAAGKKKMQAWADELLVEGRAGEYNEAMMELGALVCVPVAPKCADCPLQSACQAFAKGKPDAYPVMKKKAKVPHIVVGAAVTVNRKGEVLIAQRLEGDMLGGLWEFPGGKLEPDETIEECIARELKEELGINVEVGDFLMTVKHAYSHFTMTMHVYYTKIISGRPRPIHCADYKWVKVQGPCGEPAESIEKFAYSKADLHVVTKLQEKASAQRR